MLGPQGSVYVGGRYGGAVLALDGTGKVDLGFGRGGVARYGTDDFYMTSLALQPDGKLLAAGAGGVSSPASDGSDFALLRLDGVGALDKTFAAPSGFVFYDVSSEQTAATYELA